MWPVFFAGWICSIFGQLQGRDDAIFSYRGRDWCRTPRIKSIAQHSSTALWNNKCKSECTKHIQSLHAAAVALHLGGSNVSHKAETGHWGRYCWGFPASRNSGINRSKQEEQGGIQGRNEANEARLRSPWWKNAFIAYLVTGRTPGRLSSVDCAGLVRSKGSRCRDCCPIVFLRFSASLPHIFIPVSSSDDDVFRGTGGSFQSASAGTMFQMRTSSSGCRFYSRPQCSPRIFPS